MPALLDIQHALYRSLVEGDDAVAAAHIVPAGLAPEARLNVYRNTVIAGLTKALQLSFPAVHRLVGAAFFESAARIFIEADPPRCGYLDDYGETFPQFLQDFAPAASLFYLGGVAQLEWAVGRAIHAPDVPPLDLGRLRTIASSDHGCIVFKPHPSVSLIRFDYPVEAIWRAVLAQDDDAMARIDLSCGPQWLLIERNEDGPDVVALSEPDWRFASRLCAGHSLQSAIDAAPEIGASVGLAEHLAAGRFVDVALVDCEDLIAAPETQA